MTNHVFKGVCVLCFIAYLILLTQLIVFKYHDPFAPDFLSYWSVEALSRNLATANIIPFRTMSSSLFHTQYSVEIPTLIYNVIAFFPLGFLLPCIMAKARTLKAALIGGLIVSLTFELAQLVAVLGSADIDDVLLNVAGVAVGYTLFRLASAAYQKFRRKSPEIPRRRR
jgi:glycopeptide antibiotics resistance protein